MASKIKVDQIQTADGSGTIALQNQLSGLTSASMPTGSVLQVVHGGTATAVNVSTSNWTSIGLSAAITPISTSSKILVTVNLSVAMGSWQSNDFGIGVQILRGSTAIFANGNQYTFAYYNNANSTSTSHVYQRPSMSYLDSPSTSSATTYELKVGTYSNRTVNMQTAGGRSDITLMEIAG